VGLLLLIVIDYHSNATVYETRHQPASYTLHRDRAKVEMLHTRKIMCVTFANASDYHSNATVYETRHQPTSYTLAQFTVIEIKCRNVSYELRKIMWVVFADASSS
jgi:hypothetical protein